MLPLQRKIPDSLISAASAETKENGGKSKMLRLTLMVALKPNMFLLLPALQYGHAEAGGVEHIPPGWSFWVGLVRVATLRKRAFSENVTTV